MILPNSLNAMDEIYTKHWDTGIYACSKCGNPLFRSDDKFHSGTRWPSFRVAMPGAITTQPDHSQGMDRIELLCAKCQLHLGHVFDDGKLCGDTHRKAGLRYCILSSALNFKPKQG